MFPPGGIVQCEKKILILAFDIAIVSLIAVSHGGYRASFA